MAKLPASPRILTTTVGSYQVLPSYPMDDFAKSKIAAAGGTATEI